MRNKAETPCYANRAGLQVPVPSEFVAIDAVIAASGTVRKAAEVGTTLTLPIPFSTQETSP